MRRLSAALVLVPAVVAIAAPPAPSSAPSSPPSSPPPGMVRLGPTVFTMGSDRGEPDEKPAHSVSLPAFDLDRDEVSAADYARCVTAGKCKPPRRAPAAPDAAASWVSWFDAASYCAFVGKRLPTEAEWERAARGAEGREYPWGNDVDCSRANFGNFSGDGRCRQNPGHPVAPGRYPRGTTPEGVRDLAGNVFEWVADWYAAHWRYTAGSGKRAMGDPRGPSSGTRRVLKGSGCCSIFGLPRAANRIAFPPDYADDDIGFRCAADVKRQKR